MSKKMLIIGDDVVGRELLRLVFEDDGFHCVEAENSVVGLTMLKSQAFDLIILDNMMSGMTGLEFLSHLQRGSEQSEAPIIMITGWPSFEFCKKATKLGAYAIVNKPYDLGELRALVSQLCLTRPSLLQEVSILSN